MDNTTRRNFPRPPRRPRRRPRTRIRAGRVIGLIIVLLLIVTIILLFVFAPNRNGEDDVNGSNGTPTQHQTPEPTTGPNLPPIVLPGVGENIVVSPTARDRYDKILWLDAGHGGIDGGTSALHNGVMYLERDIVLDITMMAYEMFQNSDSGIKVFLLRETNDFYMQARYRPAVWNDTADFVVSVHLNFFPHENDVIQQSVCGIEVFYYNTGVNTGRFDVANDRFAQIMMNHLVRETGARDRSIRSRIYPEITLAIPTGSTMPAVIVEAGYMSNRDELALLVTVEYQMRIARAIYSGVREAFGV